MNAKRRADGIVTIKTSHRGFVLPLVMIMMLFLVIICGAVLAMARMNVKYDSTFEQWSAIEHATMSVAEIMAKKLAASGDAWWTTGPPFTPARGSFDMTTYNPPMWFTYDVTVSSDAGGGYKKYTLTVKGGYAVNSASDASKRIWELTIKDIRSGDLGEWVLSRDI